MEGGGGDSSCGDGVILEVVEISVVVSPSVWLETITRALGGAGSSIVVSSSSINDRSCAISSNVGSVTSIVVAVPSDPDDESMSSESSPVYWLTGGSGMLQ